MSDANNWNPRLISLRGLSSDTKTNLVNLNVPLLLRLESLQPLFIV